MIKKVFAFPGYFVSDAGIILSAWDRAPFRTSRTGTLLRPVKPYLNPCGQLQVVLARDGKGHTKRVNYLVLCAFVGPCPPHRQAWNIDGNKLNNALGNLKWATRRECLGLPDPEAPAVLSEIDQRDMQVLHRNGTEEGEIAERFGVSRSRVREIVSRETARRTYDERSEQAHWSR